MNVIIGGGKPYLPALASATSLRYACSMKDLNARSLIIPSRKQQQQLQSSGNSTTNDAPIPLSKSDQSTQGQERSEPVNLMQSQNIKIPQASTSANNTSSKETPKTNRKSRKEKASRKAVRRLRILQAKAAESTSKSVQERTLSSISKVFDEWLTLNEPKRSLMTYNDKPSPDDKEEWRRAMHRLFSVFRKGSMNDNSLDYRINSTKEKFKYNDTEKGDSRKSEFLLSNTQANEENSWNKSASNFRASRASLNAQVIEQARQSQPEITPNENITIGSAMTPGSGIRANPAPFTFEKTTMRYPPADRYPPPIPLVRELDLDLVARAFRINRACDVHWVPGKGNDHSDGTEAGGAWRKIMYGADYFAQNMDSDRMDNGQGLEYLGDSVLHLVSRSCIMERFPRRSMMLYNLAANWIVSNDVFGHIYIDSGLGEERNFVAEILLHQSKQRQLEQMQSILTTEQFQLRQNAPLPAQQLPVLHHLRQADLFEGYVGAIFLTFGYHKAAEWCSALLEPWLDRVGRTENFLSPHNLTQAGEVRARIEEKIREEIRKEYEQRQQDGILTSASKWMRSTFDMI